MGRRRGAKIDGWLILDKPSGMTSNQALGSVKRLYNPQKAGFAGTLDPLASGVLPIALGEATKTLPYVLATEKHYEFTVHFGQARDTDDAEGRVTAEDPDAARKISADAIRAVLPAFLGQIDQLPPSYSAKKIAGERAYDLARAGRTVTLKPARVIIHTLELVETNAEDVSAQFRMRCGKGTYVRAVARDMAAKLNTVGHVTRLRRTRTGPFDHMHAIGLDNLQEVRHKPALDAYLLPVETALDDIPALAVTGNEAARVKNGQPLRRPTEQEALYMLVHAGRLLAIARNEHGLISPVRVFNLDEERKTDVDHPGAQTGAD